MTNEDRYWQERPRTVIADLTAKNARLRAIVAEKNTQINAAYGHIAAALGQTIDTDDGIIVGHLRDAYAILCRVPTRVAERDDDGRAFPDDESVRNFVEYLEASTKEAFESFRRARIQSAKLARETFLGAPQ